MQAAYIVDAVRTPIGRYGGVLSTIRPDDMLALLIRSMMERNPTLDPNSIEDVIAGATNQAGEDNRDVARMSALLAGLPVSVAGNTVNRLCASGMQAVMDAARAIMCGEGDVYLAGGVESMTRAPLVMPKPDAAYSRKTEIVDSTIGWRFTNRKLADMYYPYSMGETAENIATRWKISREAQDEFALASQIKYKAALDAGIWPREIIPVPITPNKQEQVVISNDEHPRETSLEKLAGLRPAFAKEGSVTAGNSAGINDGAALVLIVSEQALKQYNLKPLMQVKSMAVAGVDPAIMGIGPVPATEKALKRAGITASQLDLIELNEAFAVQALACIQDLGLDPSKINVNGGSIAMGHPLGCTGARIVGTLGHEMKRLQGVKYGLTTMCVGVGQGAAMIFENL
ncbi:MAG: acetyl-CoA acetyltransferase [Bacteroidetes bacterium]|uniref:thiolase family protein n=1 Tax=unclassified Chitinophaga TaxID=2619133 RepID=UPI0009CEC24B|nr:MULTISPECIES: acetyl-CoA C-acyltransferase [unclassified Chitinophaga]MBP1650843.1 acetyl-CoA acetyltransferase [Bacteroidota bacterium]OMP75310.1 beta-ketoadipyl CoA thiolase [[Flexibacter] sp. ATCC 35208]WPV69120.1 acetyl-CoA C-acyltransferase [Chitinophaga sp. LS1]